MPYGLSDSALERIVHVFKTFPNIKCVLLFGSRAMGRYREGSDIDLAVDGIYSLNEIIELRLQLDQLMLGYSFDIVPLTKDLNSQILDHIHRVGVVLFER